jgi:hypothetical protein
VKPSLLAAETMADYQQQLQYTLLPDGTLAATLLLSFPNGARRSFTARLTPQDAAHAAARWAHAEGAHAVAGILRGAAAEPTDPGHWWWLNGEAKRLGKRVSDEAALLAWWRGMSQASRATYRAIFFEGPKGSATAKRLWWERLGKKRRNLAQERHGESGGIGDDIVSTVKKIDRAIDKSALGKVAQVALPVFALGRWSFKNPAKAAAFIPGGSTAAEAIKTGVEYLPAAKKLAAGKVMEAASKSLEATGKTPIAAGAAKALGIAARLSAADAAHSLGAGKAAAQHVAEARALLASVSPSTARDLYALAKRTRKAVTALATGATGVKLPASVLKAAQLGHIKSNKRGAVSRDELAAAFKAGRVFFVKAA